jgi:uncharacterized damage-inducible protein DinB
MTTSPALSGEELGALLRRAHESDPWYGSSTSELLAQVDHVLASRRLAPGVHTIWEIVLHMTSWQAEVARRLDGSPPALPVEGDWPQVAYPTPQAWAAAQEELSRSLQLVADRVSLLGTEALAAPVGETRDPALGTGFSTAQTVVGLLQHNAYHSGQLALLLRSLLSGVEGASNPSLQRTPPG